MSDPYRHLTIRQSIIKMITEDCVREYLKHHPEMKHIRITQNKILYEIAKFYLES